MGLFTTSYNQIIKRNIEISQFLLITINKQSKQIAEEYYQYYSFKRFANTKKDLATSIGDVADVDNETSTHP